MSIKPTSITPMANYKSSTDEGKCIFCEIIKGNIQTPGVFWKNNEFMAFLSTWPSVEGFTVVVPKKHTYLDCNSNKISRLDSLGQCKNLLSLDCSDNPISSLKVLSGISFLNELVCNSINIHSSDDIQGLTHLSYLQCNVEYLFSKLARLSVV